MNRLFRVFIPSSVWALLASDTILTASSFLLATYLVMEVEPVTYLLYDGGLARIFVIVLTILTGLHLQDLYLGFRVKSRILLLQDLCVAVGWAFLLQGLIIYADPDLKAPMPVILWGSLLALVAVFLGRVFLGAHMVEILGRSRLLLVGGSPLLDDIGKHIGEHPELGLQVAGYVRDLADPGEAPASGELLGPVAALREMVEAAQPDRIVVGLFGRGSRAPVVELLELRFAGYAVEGAATAYERIRGRVCLTELRPSQLVETRPRDAPYRSLWNIAVAAAGIAVTAPVMAAVALAVKLSSPGPILSRQARTGLHNSVFTLYKFRTVRADGADGPRLTGAGRVLRQLRLDDLPQLFNVLKGDMSIVGPRPERPEYVAAISGQLPYYRQRHCVRPGITGWAQINFSLHGELLDTVAKLERDLYYIKNMSLGMDTFILFHAVKALVVSRGSV